MIMKWLLGDRKRTKRPLTTAFNLSSLKTKIPQTLFTNPNSANMLQGIIHFFRHHSYKTTSRKKCYFRSR